MKEVPISRDDDWICRPALVLTVYLAAPPTCADSLAAWRVYSSYCPVSQQRYIMHRGLADFDELAPEPTEADVRPYAEPLDQWRDQGLVVWDGGDASCWSLTVQGMYDVEGPDQASFCQVIFPDGTAPEVAIGMARGMLDSLPLLSGHCGYSALFKSTMKTEAFDRIYGWAKRYWGLEVEDMNTSAAAMLNGVKGANWLTLVGSRWLSWLDPHGLSGPPARGADVSMLSAAHGRLYIAGVAPVLADRNRGEFPHAYAQVERIIAPVKIDSHPEFWGRFDEELATLAWLNRLLKPAGW